MNYPITNCPTTLSAPGVLRRCILPFGHTGDHADDRGPWGLRLPDGAPLSTLERWAVNGQPRCTSVSPVTDRHQCDYPAGHTGGHRSTCGSFAWADNPKDNPKTAARPEMTTDTRMSALKALVVDAEQRGRRRGDVVRRGGALAAQVHVSEAQAAELQAHINRVLGLLPAARLELLEHAKRLEITRAINEIDEDIQRVLLGHQPVPKPSFIPVWPTTQQPSLWELFGVVALTATVMAAAVILWVTVVPR